MTFTRLWGIASNISEKRCQKNDHPKTILGKAPVGTYRNDHPGTNTECAKLWSARTGNTRSLCKVNKMRTDVWIHSFAHWIIYHEKPRKIWWFHTIMYEIIKFVLTDNGSACISKHFGPLCAFSGSYHLTETMYHLEKNRKADQFHTTIIARRRCYLA